MKEANRRHHGPVAPKLADKILALTASLLYALVYLHDRVERLVIYLLH